MMKFSKEDIEKVYRTSPMEESLLVFQAEGDTSKYIEYAVVKVPKKSINEIEIRQWIDSISRFRDAYIYENDTPIRIRFKNAFYPICLERNDEICTLQHMSDYMQSLQPRFDVQEPPIYTIGIIHSGSDTFIGLAYHHILFDGLSVQMALSKLDPLSSVQFTDWLPLASNKISNTLTELEPFKLEDLLPPADPNLSGFIKKEFDFKGLDYEDVMIKWLSFLKFASGKLKVVVGEVFSARGSDSIAAMSLGYYVQNWPLELNVGIEKAQLKIVRSEVLQKAHKPVKNHFTPNAFDHCWVVEPSVNTHVEVEFYSTPHYVLTITLTPSLSGTKVGLLWNLSKTNSNAAEQVSDSFMKFIENETIGSLYFEPFSIKDTSILDLWNRSVSSHFNDIAIEDNVGTKLTYKELDIQSSALANKLPIAYKDRVGVHTTYSSSIVVAILAVLKKGGIYVPLDPTVSSDRINYIIQDAGISVVISDLETKFDALVISPKVTDGEINFKPLLNSGLKDTCYLIYTSGTTGKPKGCAVNHGNLINLFLGTKEKFEFNAKDTWILAHSYGFDFSTWEIWGSLLNGSRLFIPDRDQVKDTFTFHRLLKEKGVTILNQTPKSFYNLILVDTAFDLRDLRYVVFGGDKLQIERLLEWMPKYSDVKLINMYGITETTVHVTFKEVVSEYHSNIGMPLPGYGLSLRNSEEELVPDGFLGELFIDGNGVCNGYFQKPELTSENFVSNGKTYRSGDLAWKIGADFYYYGRQDRQVKIRGFRIELGEIEFLLKKKFEGCDFTALVVDESRLITFYEGENISIDNVDFRSNMPDYAIPSWFLYLEEFPLNQSGKIDERKLLNLYHSSNSNNKDEQNDSSLLQSLLKETLGRTVDSKKSFIQNGGDSISAIRLISKLKKEGLNLTVQDLFENTPLIDLKSNHFVSVIEKDYLIEFKKEIGVADSQVYFPLSEAQQGILMDCLRNDDKSIYMEILNYEIPASHSIEQISKAYELVCRNNPILLSNLKRVNGEYVFKVGSDISQVKEIDASLLPSFCETLQKKGMDIFGSLSEIYVINCGDTHRVFWVHHHLILDGWSLGVFSKLMMDALKGMKLSYSDRFIRFLCQAHLESKISNYWQKVGHLKQLESLIPDLPERNVSSSYIKRSVIIKFNNQDIIKEWNLSEHSLTLGLWTAFNSLLFGRKEYCVGNVVSLRSTEDYETLGMYVRTLPFHDKFREDFTVETHLKHVFKLLQKDHAHMGEPLNHYVNADLFDHLFVYENYPIDDELLSSGGVKVLDFKERTGASWTTIVYPRGNSYEFSVLFDTGTYAAHYVETILNHFSDWASRLSWSDSLSSSLELIKRNEKSGENSYSYNNKSIIEILARKSSNNALVNNGDVWSYGDLWAEAEKLSLELQSYGHIKNEAVGMDLQSTINFTLSMLAVWIAGGVTCSVDRRYPKGRKEFIYNNAGVRFVFVSKDGLKIEKRLKFKESKTIEAGASFILHTSGSGGEPKGVVQTHHCLLNLINWNKESFGLSSDERILQLSSFGFDASFHEILLTLSLGGTLIEIPLDSRLDIHEIKRYILSGKVTMAWIPARLLNAVLDTDPFFFDECDTLKRIVTTGEALVIGSELKELLHRKNIILLNYYGPTETHVVTASEVNNENVTTQPYIGKVLPNCEILLMDGNNEVSFDGLPGEIWVAGPNNALGYLNDPIQTSSKFVNFNKKKWYKTGDWAYCDDQDNFHFIGRKDDQVKIRGFRVEPLEVERMITDLQGVNQCCILILEQQVTCFYVSDLSDEELRTNCIKLMPDYMIPESWVKLELMPLNDNGKVDRKKLRKSVDEEIVNGLEESDFGNAFRCWKEILEHTRFGSESRFEWVGGNSIMLMKMQTWLERNYKVFVSISELNSHNTLQTLESLLDHKFQEADQVLPEIIQLNALQRDMLISELGSDDLSNSPFILRFDVELEEKISQEDFENAVESLLGQFPQLTYVLGNYEAPESSVFKKGPESVKFFESFGSEFKFDNPLIRFIHKGNSKVEIQWHHILLDGLSMGILLRHLVEIIEGTHQKRFMPVYPFVDVDVLKISGIKVRINRARAVNRTKKFSESELKELEKKANRLNIPLSIFLYETISRVHNYSTLGIADVENHPGIPGMFTDLRSLQFTPSKDMEGFGGFIMDCNPAEEIRVVANYMEIPINTDWVRSLNSGATPFTKYPFEWQFIRLNEAMEVTFYFANNDRVGQTIFEQWDRNLVALLLGEVIEEKVASDKDIFDNFDF